MATATAVDATENKVVGSTGNRVSGPRTDCNAEVARLIIGQEAPLALKQIWAIRIPLQMARRVRDLALFNLVIDSMRGS